MEKQYVINTDQLLAPEKNEDTKAKADQLFNSAQDAELKKGSWAVGDNAKGYSLYLQACKLYLQAGFISLSVKAFKQAARWGQ